MIRLPKVRESRAVIEALNAIARDAGVSQHEALRQILAACISQDDALGEAATGCLDSLIAPCLAPVSLVGQIRSLAAKKQVSASEIIRRALRRLVENNHY